MSKEYISMLQRLLKLIAQFLFVCFIGAKFNKCQSVSFLFIRQKHRNHVFSSSVLSKCVLIKYSNNIYIRTNYNSVVRYFWITNLYQNSHRSNEKCRTVFGIMKFGIKIFVFVWSFEKGLEPNVYGVSNKIQQSS